MRLAFILPGLGAGGAERVASRLAGHWAEHGHEVHLLLLAAPGERPYYPLHPAVRLHPLGLMGRSQGLVEAIRANLRRVRRLRRAVAALGPAVLLAFLPETAALAVLAALGRRLPVIVSERNAPTDEPLAIAWRLAREAAYRRAAAVVFQTERARDVFPSGVRARGLVIPNPIVAPPAAAVLDARRVVAAGRLVRQKGFDLLLPAFADAAASRPGWSLTIWGEGPERPALEALVRRLGLEGRVALPGVSASPGDWLAGGSIFVLPSRFEGFPNVLGEAMAAGYPVIAADCRFGPREMVSDGADGLLVPPEDPAALAAALGGLMDDADRRDQLGEAARRSAERFAPAAVALRWDRLLADIAVEVRA